MADAHATRAAGAPVVGAKALVRRYLEDVFTNGNVDAIDRYLDGDRFKAGVVELVARWRTAFSDFRISVHDVIVEDDRVVTVELLSGTHDGVYASTVGPIQPTGRTVQWSRIAIRFLRDGRFVDGFFEEDEVGLLKQMDALEVGDDRAAGDPAPTRATGSHEFRARDARARRDRDREP